MKTNLKQISLSFMAVLTLTTLSLAPAAAQRNDGPSDDSTPTTTSATTTDVKHSGTDESKPELSGSEKTHIESIRKRSEGEVNRRTGSLNGLIKKVNAASFLTAAQKATLVAELNAQISGLTNVKTEVQNDTDVASAKDDAQKIITDYHVYAFIVPKVQIILTADRQQVIESKLSDAAAKLLVSIDAAKTAGKDVTALQAKLDDLLAKVASAQSISSKVQSDVLALQSTGTVTTDRTALKGYRDQLKTARSTIGLAFNDAKAIVNGLKSE